MKLTVYEMQLIRNAVVESALNSKYKGNGSKANELQHIRFMIEYEIDKAKMELRLFKNKNPWEKTETK